MRKVIQHESKTYLAPMPVVVLLEMTVAYSLWKSSWIECTGFEIGQEVEEGEWEIVERAWLIHTSSYQGEADHLFTDHNEAIKKFEEWSKYNGQLQCKTTIHQLCNVAIPEQQPEREEEEKACGICGSGMVYIRGKYPKQEKRLICPCCAFERLEQINEISSLNYGKTYTEISPLTNRTKE